MYTYMAGRLPGPSSILIHEFAVEIYFMFVFTSND